MKKTLAVLTLLAGAVSGYSQGQVYMGDYALGDFQITIWSPQTPAANAGTQLQGNSPSTFGTGTTLTGPDVPSGTQTGYTGVPLGGSASGAAAPTDFANGSLWSVQLYAAPYSGTLDSTLPAADAVAGTVANMYTVAGNTGTYNSSVTATIPGVPGGSAAELQLKAWYNGGGTITSYEAAVAAGGATAPNGVSSVGAETLVALPGTPNDLPGPGDSYTLAGGITSFNVTGSAIPEPSTIALGLVGASAFLMRLRRK